MAANPRATTTTIDSIAAMETRGRAGSIERPPGPGNSIAVAANGLAPVAGRDGAPDIGVDRVLHPGDVAVAEQHVHAARVEAPGRPPCGVVSVRRPEAI